MERTIADSLAQITRGTIRREPPETNQLTGRITDVNYNARRIQVFVKGHANIRRVGVGTGVLLGTQQKPNANRGDIAHLQRDPVHKRWVCVQIERKVKCAPFANTSDSVEVDTQFSDAFITQNYGASLTPFDTFLPPFEAGGDFALPSQSPPQGDAYDFGDGFNGAIASGTTQEQLYFAAVNLWTMLTISLYSVDTDLTYLVDVDGVNVITATRVAGDWTIQGASAGSSDTVAGFILPTPIPITIGQVIRTAIQADADMTGLAAGVHGA